MDRIKARRTEADAMNDPIVLATLASHPFLPWLFINNLKSMTPEERSASESAPCATLSDCCR